jgi:hypothetical protein
MNILYNSFLAKSGYYFISKSGALNTVFRALSSQLID